MSLRVKKDESEGAVRLAYTDGDILHKADVVQSNPGKIFAVIGPFDNHTDKTKLQEALLLVCRGFNVTEK